ncbi:hexitol phosphatase HxpB [Ferruginibacter lapsinanis]|uniref:hexitol phosphatase HxpB n=1 Tax=Ferruginibacter lapsinanis TaxID=563172 RepID=UPI001E598075|nr:hexitol phosphatase HxpB [Ferruginibacter lapsinanis]UEG48568.1 hexitol phosphatase HxpB [Ferruginibacter lapsinanis]
MQLNTVIFDMDGVLIDSEPLWSEATDEVFKNYGIQISQEQYSTTTGLRTKEFVNWWFTVYKIPQEKALQAERDIVETVVSKINQKGKAMPGLSHIFNFFIDRKFKIGLATSSGFAVIDTVVDKLGIRNYLQAISSADQLEYGKPHPQVYLNCAEKLNTNPSNCICFEDSFNGLIAAKAAKMKCVVIPAPHESQHVKFNAADLKISSLQNFNELLMQSL